MIWQLAGIAGVNPGPLTLRELIWMAESNSRQRWAHTSTVLAMIANVNRDPKKHGPFKPADFNPHVERAVKIKTSDLSILKDIFVKGKANERS